MAGTPKRRGSQSRQGRRRSQPRHKATMPQLTQLGSGVRVPAHTVTPLNPTYKGVKFLATKKSK